VKAAWTVGAPSKISAAPPYGQFSVGGWSDSILTKPLRQSQFFCTMLKLLAHRTVSKRVLAAPTPVMDKEMGRRHPLRILVAEDNVVNQKLAIRLLQQLGYPADLAANDVEAIQSVEREPYDVVLMAVQMPDMDGIEAVRRICTLWPEFQRPRLKAMTANPMDGDREECLVQALAHAHARVDI
jgi:CheY-like chemotaxis protein